MKIIMLNDYGFVNGGASQVAITEALTLADAGYPVTYLCVVGPPDQRLVDHPAIDAVVTGGYAIPQDPNRLRAVVQGIWNTTASKKLSDLLKEHDPADTIVHLHSWSRALTASVSRLTQAQGFPLVCTLHDYFIVCPNGGFYLYPKQTICHLEPLSWACLLEDCDAHHYTQKLWRFSRSVVQKYPGRLPSPWVHLIAVSAFSQNIITPHIAQDIPISLLPNPIQIEKKPPAQPQRQQSYTFIGRLSPDKGPLLLAQANHDQTFKTTYVGDGALKRAIQSADPQADLPGWLAHPAAIDYLNRTRALVFPSRVYETQGMVVLEAAARGVPSVVADSSAATEFVEHGITGLWFEHGNANSLRAALTALGDDHLVARLGQAAYEKFWQNPLTSDQHLRGLLSIYQNLLNNRNVPLPPV